MHILFIVCPVSASRCDQTFDCRCCWTSWKACHARQSQAAIALLLWQTYKRQQLKHTQIAKVAESHVPSLPSLHFRSATNPNSSVWPRSCTTCPGLSGCPTKQCWLQLCSTIASLRDYVRHLCQWDHPNEGYWGCAAVRMWRDHAAGKVWYLRDTQFLDTSWWSLSKRWSPYVNMLLLK